MADDRSTVGEALDRQQQEPSASSSNVTRRTFLGAVGASALAWSCGGHREPPQDPATTKEARSPSQTPTLPATAGQTGLPIPRRRLGRTNVMVSAIGLGGYHLGLPAEDEAIRMMHYAIDHGLDFMDNCWSYHKGRSEERMGKALQGSYRQRAFVMTKLDARTFAAAPQQLEQSLQRLRTDVIDLVQVHEVIRMEEPGRVFAADGCMEALIAARKAGKIRFIGFTGHKDPSIHLAMLAEADRRGFVFDTVQMPLNVMDAHYHSFEQQVLPVLRSKDIGIIGMKALGSGKILDSGAASAEECLRYTLSLPTSTLVTGCDNQERLDQAIRVASTFSPLTAPERQALLAKTAPHAGEGKYERFKTSTDYDGTVHHPEWMDSANI